MACRVLICSLVITAGCVSSRSRRGSRPAPAKQSTPLSALQALRQVIALSNKDEQSKALALVRDQIRSPAVGDRAHQIDLRVMGLTVLFRYVRTRPFTAPLDAEAARYFEQGMKLASDDAARQAEVRRVYANYFSSSSRNGLALPYLHADLKYREEEGEPYMLFIANDGLASVYSDLGEYALKHHYRQKALALARKYFASGKASPFEWLQYKKVLMKTMDSAASRGDWAAVKALWLIVEPIVKKYLAPKFPSYLSTAELLAIAGQAEAAEVLFAQGKQIGAQDKHPLLSATASCRRVNIDSFAGRFPQAATAARVCLAARTKAGMSTGFSTHRSAAQAFEGNGEFKAAISQYKKSLASVEELRSTYSVAVRAKFFRGVFRESYWGLIRATLKQKRGPASPQAVLRALKFSEMVRARQLGDLRQDATTEVGSLSQLRRTLQSDELLLSFITMDDTPLGYRIAAIAVTKETQRGSLIVVDRNFDAEVKRLGGLLAEPSSSLATINQLSGRIGARLFAGVKDLLAKKRKLILLPDGVLNGIPLDTLRLGSTEAPLLTSHEVSLSPSVGYLLAARRKRSAARAQGGFFALADPNYPEKIEIGGLTSATLRGATGNSDFEGYFSALPETREEVTTIAGLFPEGEATLLLGDKAVESQVKNADLSGYRYVHFATHGILGNDVPGVSEPALVLGDEPGEDGFLTASEAAALRLNAELTVLSACKTGSGKYYTGEGVMGLSRSFLLAGSQAVLVSLWAVDSQATQRLMSAFYRKVHQGLSAANALRSAKLEMRRDGVDDVGASRGIRRVNPSKPAAARHPFYWSAFVILGG